ncbi:MAG: bifunctional DNA primase/polymerase [Thermofilum sp.]|uniref:bifunctional DNA primase/polymerase n=1 Tax=Thermofilum sp. TaxID=1961369 RepID=UPI00258B0F14|nr:bifunctional DNA primase/polymerase [Thermofilum sp.]MCI4409727.1 bifunctional DNA primase/polymerase [Thermofilum sp.]
MSDLFAKPVGGPSQRQEQGQGQPQKPAWDKEKIREIGLYFLNQGANLIPLPWGRKDSPLVSWKKYQEERVTAEQLEKWLNNEKWISEHGGINLAVVCGKISNLIVLDFDVKESYFGFLSSLPKELRDKVTSQCIVVETGKGFHVYVRPKNPEKIPRVIPEGQKAKLPGVSIRGEGAYAVAPGSLHPSGIIYRFVTRPERLGEFEDQEIDIILGAVKDINDVINAGKEVGEIGEDTEKIPEIEPSEWKPLIREDIDKIVELLRPAYVKNHRHWIRMWLSGWGAFYGIDPLSLAEVFLKLVYDPEEESKPEFIRKKLGDILDTYKRYLVLTGRKDADQVIEAVKEEMSKQYGVTPYTSTTESFEVKLKAGEIKGVAGKNTLKEEILASLIEQGKAKEEAEKEVDRIINELKNILGKYRARKKADRQDGYIFVTGLRRVRGSDEWLKWVDAKIEDGGIRVYVASKKYMKDRDTGKLDYEIIEEEIAFVPRDIYVVPHPFMDKKEYYVLKNDGKIHAIFGDMDELIEYLTKKRPWIVNPQASKEIQAALKHPALVKYENIDLIIGITKDGRFNDPYGKIDLNDYGVVGLIEARKWIEEVYPEPNRLIAKINVAVFIGKIVSPMVKYYQSEYNDYYVYNYGRGGEGKTMLFNRVMLPLIDMASQEKQFNLDYISYIKGGLSQAQIRNLVDLNRLPIIFDEQQKDTLVQNISQLISYAIGSSPTGVHAKRYGRGLEEVFGNYRGIIIGTNCEYRDFLDGMEEKKTAVEAGVRRFLVLNWEPTRPVIKDVLRPPKIKPILGAIVKVLSKPEVREKVIQTANVIDTAQAILEALQEEYGEPLQDYIEALNMARQIIREKEASATETEREIIVKNALKVAEEKLKITNPDKIKVLKAILEFPEVADIGYSYPRGKEERKKVAEEEKTKFSAMKEDYKRLEEIEDIVNKLLSGENPTPEIVIFANGSLIKSTPRKLLGKEPNKYGKERRGYKFRLTEFISLFLEPEAKEEQEEQETQEKEEEPKNIEVSEKKEENQVEELSDQVQPQQEVQPEPSQPREIKAENGESWAECSISMGRILEEAGPLTRQELVERLKQAGYTDKAIGMAISYGLRRGNIAEAGDKIILLNK